MWQKKKKKAPGEQRTAARPALPPRKELEARSGHNHCRAFITLEKLKSQQTNNPPQNGMKAKVLQASANQASHLEERGPKTKRLRLCRFGEALMHLRRDDSDCTWTQLDNCNIHDSKACTVRFVFTSQIAKQYCWTIESAFLNSKQAIIQSKHLRATTSSSCCSLQVLFNTIRS